MTKHLIKILFFVTWMIDPATAQIIEHGTYFVARFTEDYAVVAIDSRQTLGVELPDYARHRPPNDRFCKILPLGRNAFFFSRGVESKLNENNEVVFDVRNIAHQVYIQFGIGTTKLDEVAKAWAAQVETFYYTYPEATKAAVNGIMNNGFFVGENADGSINYVERAIMSQSGYTGFYSIPIERQKLDQIPADFPTNINGYLELLKEFYPNSLTPRAQEALSKIDNSLTGLDRIAAQYIIYVKAVKEWSHESAIGGDIAAIILERGKPLRWFSRPDFCPEK